MTTKIIRALIFILVYSISIYAQPPQIVQLINKVNKDSLALYIRQLSGDTSCVIGGQSYTIISRHKNQPGNDKAAQFIYEKFQSWGFQVQYETFSSTGKNVIATKQGMFDSQKYFVICAHYDDMPSGTTAPGADDNASGTATVLELARVFSQYNFNYTIKFICFDEEEQGLVGSNYYATQARNRNDSIIGVINLDMTAYDANNDGMVDVHSNSVANTAQIANEWINNIYQYSIELITRTVASQPYSDHYSFQQKNYGAILVIEYDLEFNPRYHTVNDKFQYLNMNFAHKIAKVTAATAAEYIQVALSNSTNIFTDAGWNLISIPLIPVDGRKSTLFPQATSLAYTYDGSYITKDTLEVGKGYWLKFENSLTHTLTGQIINSIQIPVKAGWNLIGSLNSTIPVTSIITSPPNIISSYFYSYSGSYNQAQYLEKGKGYWVKCLQNGFMSFSTLSKNQVLSLPSVDDAKFILTFISNENAQKLYLIEKDFTGDFFELPPESPSGGFDVRFIDNYFVSKLSSDEKIIKIKSSNYPVRLILSSGSNENALRIKYQSNGIEYHVILTNGEEILLDRPIDFIKVKKENLPKNFVLRQNFPNPFNPITKINFYIPVDSRIKLKIFNLKGELVDILIDGKLNAGNHSVVFNGSSLPSGVYFYELTNETGFRDIKKMILIK
ncbi:MAG: M20/M25/M40 family metallo-hydrolase [Ignavibacteria bacterium]